MTERNTEDTRESAGFKDDYFVGSQSKVKNSIHALELYMASMNCAINKAKSGSDCEDGYFLEKLEKMCNRLGYDLVKK